jgi:hypothetical protein
VGRSADGPVGGGVSGRFSLFGRTTRGTPDGPGDRDGGTYGVRGAGRR